MTELQRRSRSQTMFLYASVLAMVLLSISKATLQDIETGEVIFVNVLFRHGERTPVFFYQNDPYKNSSYWPVQEGQLTNLGKRQVFELGKWLRSRYDTLLTEHYNPDIIYIQSTDKDRTLMSAQLSLAGMFPPSGAQEWSEDIAWQPIPVHTTPLDMDKVLSQPPRVPCPAFQSELYRVLHSDDKIKQLNETYADLLHWITEKSGEEYNLYNMYKIYDTLFIESSNNMTLPEWTKTVFPEPMREADVYNYILETWNPKLARLVTGLLLQDMIQNMVDKMQQNTSKNVHIYSAHDETITSLLNAVGAYNYMLPPYASCLMTELRIGSDGKHYVTIYYRNSTTDGPYLMTVAGCTPVCPLDQFISLSQPIIPDNWELECGLILQESNAHSTITVIVMAAVSGVAVTVILFAALYYCRRKSMGC